MSGKVTEKNQFSAILKLVLYKLKDGKIKIKDRYIPMKRFEQFENIFLPVVPSLSYYYPGYRVKDFAKVKKSLAEMIEDEIQVSKERKVKMSTKNYPQLTYQEIYDILEVKPSWKEKRRIELKKMVPTIATRKKELKEGCVAVIVKYQGYKKAEYEMTIEDAIQKRAALIIAEESCDKIPCIVVESCKNVCKKLYRTIAAKYDPITVAITGTVGKTTTKELMSDVFDTHYRTLHIEGNNNTFYSVGTILQKLQKQDEAYIQEVHGGTKDSAQNISDIIRPDIAIITNIGEAHLLDMGNMENVIKGKLDIVSGLKDTGVLVVNDDNEYLKDLNIPGKRILRYSIYNKKCDYYAQNIQDMAKKIKFQIVGKEGIFDAMLNLQGIHNVGNAVGVFACAIEAGKNEFYCEEDREAFNQKLSECIRPGDFILFKSGTRSHLKEETIYPLFGLIDKEK